MLDYFEAALEYLAKVWPAILAIILVVMGMCAFLGVGPFRSRGEKKL